jgi:hypothetical protein
MRIGVGEWLKMGERTNRFRTPPCYGGKEGGGVDDELRLFFGMLIAFLQ